MGNLSRPQLYLHDVQVEECNVCAIVLLSRSLHEWSSSIQIKN